jgi:hydrogenase maturation factor
MKLLIKYCGGCNPTINRKKLVNEVINLLQLYSVVELTTENADVGLIVGGCPVCCINIDHIKDQASELVVVGGSLVDYAKVPPDQQAMQVMQRVLMKGGERDC